MQIFHKVNNLFWNFVKQYDFQETRILQKVVHTFCVANHCFDASCRFQMTEQERAVCYMIGMFHDLGRFEQWKRYQSYDDNRTPINHGELGKEIFLRDFTPELLEISQEHYDIIANCILHHLIRFEGDDPILWKYLEIIHSADSYANLLNTSIGSHELKDYADGYTPMLLEKFMNGEKIYMYSSDTKVDRLLKSIGNAYCVTIDYMRIEVLHKNYFDTIFNTYEKFLNPEDKLIVRKAVDYIKANYKP